MLFQIRWVRNDEHTHFRLGDKYCEIWQRESSDRDWAFTNRETATLDVALRVIETLDPDAPNPEVIDQASDAPRRFVPSYETTEDEIKDMFQGYRPVSHWGNQL